MCGRFSSRLSWSELHDLYDLSNEPMNLEPRSNIAPTQSSLVIRRDGAGRRTAAMLRWGLVPFWARTPQDVKMTTINARAETIAAKPAYRDAVRKRRAISVACGWMEWTGEKGAKQPWRFVRVDGEPLSLAAIWDRWSPKPGLKEAEGLNPVESFSIVTAAASPDTAKIHDRMPVVLEKQDLELWLDPDPALFDRQMVLLRPAPVGTLRFFPVSPRINSSRNEGPELVEPIVLSAG